MANLKTTLSDSFSIKGNWYLPETPNCNANGVLTFLPENTAELDLDGTLRNIAPGHWNDFAAKVIRGETSDGKLCTIIDAYESAYQMNLCGSATSKFCFNKLLVGREYVDPQTQTFESALIEFSGFGTWICRDPFGASRIDHGQVISYMMPKTISFQVPSLAASIRIESSINTNIKYQERTLKHTDLIRIKPKRKQSLDWYIDVIYKFRILLSLLIGVPVDISSIRICRKLRKNQHISSKKLCREYLDLCFRQTSNHKKQKFHPAEIPFPFPVVKKHMRSILESWFGNKKQLDTVYGLHFGTQLNQSTPVEFQLITFLQALEAYHREGGCDKYVSDVNYTSVQQILTQAIPDSVSKDHRTALKSRIKFGNEFSLRKRLTLTLKSVPELLRDMIICGNNKFVSQVVSTRNYLTHRDESQKADLLDYSGMYNASESLSMLLTFLLLRESGLPETLIESVMLNHMTFKKRSRMK